MTLWRPITWTGLAEIELATKQKWSTIEFEYLLSGSSSTLRKRVLGVFVSALLESAMPTGSMFSLVVIPFFIFSSFFFFFFFASHELPVVVPFVFCSYFWMSESRQLDKMPTESSNVWVGNFQVLWFTFFQTSGTSDRYRKALGRLFPMSGNVDLISQCTSTRLCVIFCSVKTSGYWKLG